MLPSAKQILLAAMILVALVALFPVLVSSTARRESFGIYTRLWAKIVAPEFVMVGDSLTAQGEPWFLKLETGPLAVINLGRPGWITGQLEGLSGYAAQIRPRVVVLLSGTNDAALGLSDISSFRRAYSANIAAAKSGSSHVIVTLAPPTSTPSWNVTLARLNAEARAVAMERGATVVDLWSKLADSDGKIQSRFTSDGVHLTREAYDIWAAAIREAANQPTREKHQLNR